MASIVGYDEKTGDYVNPMWMDTTKLSMVALLKANKDLKEYMKGTNRIELTDDEIETACKTYISNCIENADTPTPAGLAVALGTNSPVLIQALKQNNSRGNILRNYMEMINAHYQQAMVESRMQSKAYEIIAKNYMGITDVSKQELVISDTRVDEQEIAKHVESLMSRRALLLDTEEDSDE